MVTPHVLAPRGVYEGSFYVGAAGQLPLFAVRSDGVLVASRIVSTGCEYQAALAELTATLDADDPLPPLMLVE